MINTNKYAQSVKFVIFTHTKFTFKKFIMLELLTKQAGIWDSICTARVTLINLNDVGVWVKGSHEPCKLNPIFRFDWPISVLIYDAINLRESFRNVDDIPQTTNPRKVSCRVKKGKKNDFGKF